MCKQEKIVVALMKYTSPLSPFVSLEEFEEQRQQWCVSLDADDVDILLDLLVKGLSDSRLHSQDMQEVGTIIVEAISEFANRTGVNLLPKVLSKLNEFTQFLHLIELLGMLSDPDALPILVFLFKNKELSHAEQISLFWSIGQTKNPDAIRVLGDMKESLSGNSELRETIDIVLNAIAHNCL